MDSFSRITDTPTVGINRRSFAFDGAAKCFTVQRRFLFVGQAVSKNIRDALQKRAWDFGIVMEDTAITHLSFSREYTAAVEAKQVSMST